MTTITRPIATRVTVCDLCAEIIPDIDEAAEKGSITHGYLAHPVNNDSKHAWLIWPRRKRLGPCVEERHYDFHADCIGRLVEEAVATRTEADR